MTKPDSHQQAPDSSLLKKTVASKRSRAVLDLGKKLTRELDLDQSVDTLGRWMAHYIAELIYDAENAASEEKPSRMRDCSEAILDLWKHRHELPDGSRPFEALEPALRLLEKLDPDNHTPRFFSRIREAGDDIQDTESQSWLKVIDGIDYSARLLIRYCLVRAAESALEESQEWSALAEEAGVGEDADISIVRIIYNEHNLEAKPNPSAEEQERLEDRLNRLKGFLQMAESLASDLEQRLEKTKSESTSE
ncbi:AVAST type 3 anti-phage proein Avs3b [Saccharospirillum mangrovi]|uniref:AVAST type 3 anti-phage proein Avs3b n=1 Tax=Saccharospirillum mangrovi TaxID=2161747 RepID=UPI000D3A7084|nr:AVAST type 3 anti-phage proein Avs3b [Saccharospirillum mangrovi]